MIAWNWSSAMPSLSHASAIASTRMKYVDRLPMGITLRQASVEDVC